MIFHFQTGDVTFFPEDQEYFVKRFTKLEQLLGFDAGDIDSVEAHVTLSKSKHHSGGDRFEGKATIVAPRCKFHAEASTENIKKCADELKTKLRTQVEAFHGKRK